MLAAMAVLGTTTVFAANPFSDVTPDSWAYQSVSQLADAGIINGYSLQTQSLHLTQLLLPT